jgi:hypothetical protein
MSMLISTDPSRRRASQGSLGVRAQSLRGTSLSVQRAVTEQTLVTRLSVQCAVTEQTLVTRLSVQCAATEQTLVTRLSVQCAATEQTLVTVTVTVTHSCSWVIDTFLSHRITYRDIQLLFTCVIVCLSSIVLSYFLIVNKERMLMLPIIC